MTHELTQEFIRRVSVRNLNSNSHCTAIIKLFVYEIATKRVDFQLLNIVYIHTLKYFDF